MVKFLKTKDYPVKSPKCNVGEDSGIDFYVPSYSEGFVKAFKEKNPSKEIEEKDGKYFIRVAPHTDVNIPSGIYSSFPSNIALVGANKSGVASKQKLIYGAHVIDSSYQGIIHLHMINTSNDWQVINLDEKIVQFIPFIIDISGISINEESEISKTDFYEGKQTERGDKGFGSTTLD